MLKMLQAEQQLVSEAIARAPVQPRKRMPRWLVFAIVFVSVRVGILLIWLSGLLGERGSFKLGLWITRRFEPVTRRSRHANYKKFFLPAELNADQLAALDEAHHLYLAKMRSEVVRICFRKKNLEEVKTQTVLEGEEHLRRILDSGRGVMLVGGHTGTWWFVPTLLAQLGYKVNVIFTPIVFKRVERLLVDTCRDCGVKVTFVGRDAWQAVKNAVARKEIVYLAFDVPVKPKRCELLSFGNARLRVDSGPAIMAVKANLTTLQAACWHQPDGKNRISIYSPTDIEMEPQKSNALDICELWGSRLEEQIAQHPEQWWAWGYMDLERK